MTASDLTPLKPDADAERGERPLRKGIASSVSNILAHNSAWFASVGLHGVLLLIAATLLWRIADTPPELGPAPVVSFADPGESEPMPSAPAKEASRSSDSGAGESVEGATSEALPLTPELARLTPVPTLQSLASTKPAGVASLGAESSSSLGSLANLPQGNESVQTPAGQEVSFAGLGSSSARSVVYVVDASGPMVTSLPEVIHEIERSIARLAASQKFGVIVFRDSGSPDAPQLPLTDTFMPMLVRATPGARVRLSDWLTQIQPRGKSNPIDGLKAALAMKPEAIFLLSRSIERSGGGAWQLGLDETLRELDALNPIIHGRDLSRRAVVIKTIQFLDEDPTGIMQAIGREHGGAAAGDAPPGYTVIRRTEDLAKPSANEP